MRFDWEPPKAAANLMKHRVSFEEACTIFGNSSILTVHDELHSGSEDRWVSMAMSVAGRILVVIHTWPDPDELGEEVIRIISSRKANRRERDEYLKQRL